MTTPDLLMQTLILSPNVLCQELDGEAVLLDLTSETYFGLDQTGLRLWQLIEQHGDLQSVYQTMLNEYDIDEATLLDDLRAFVEQMEEAGLISRA